MITVVSGATGEMTLLDRVALRAQPQTRNLVLVTLLLITTVATVLRAQGHGELDVLLDQLGRYLVAYEHERSRVVADEHYEQQEIRVVRTGRNSSFNHVTNRKLTSDIAFLRLPGGAVWFGVRDVRMVDKKPVTTDGQRLIDIIKRIDGEGAALEATRIVAASAQYNLGGVRTINMPTTPLEILHPDHHVQFMFKVGARDKIDGVWTTKLTFEEFDVPHDHQQHHWGPAVHPRHRLGRTG